jgi:hypothetical protein
MRGQNKLFLQNTELFLGATPLRVQARAEQNSVFATLQWQQQPPVFQFDLRAFPPGAELIPFAQHARTHRFGRQRPITAYWLDYQVGQDRVCALGNGVTYVFTPMLDGCYVGVGNGRVCHIAGSANIGGSRGDTARMRQFAAAALGANPVIGFDSNHADATQMTVVGVHAAGAWSWYVQGHELFYNGHGTLQPVFDGNNVNAQPADRGRSLIRITDMTYG